MEEKLCQYIHVTDEAGHFVVCGRNKGHTGKCKAIGHVWEGKEKLFDKPKLKN